MATSALSTADATAAPTDTSKSPVSPAQSMALRNESNAFLQTLLNKNMLVHTTDGRMFRGEFKCTDPHSNVVLAHASEYRQPTGQQRVKHAARLAASGDNTKVTMDMTSRYMGLIVTPGKHIVKIEVEEFLSQIQRR